MLLTLDIQNYLLFFFFVGLSLLFHHFVGFFYGICEIRWYLDGSCLYWECFASVEKNVG